MSDAVAIAALGELAHHALRMRCAVAILALRNHFVLGFVTAYARYVLMFSRRSGQEVVGFLVASHAIFVGKVAGVGDGYRHMRLVALFALGGGLLRVVRLMALGAGRNLAMDVVARGAEEGGVLARVSFQLLDLLGVAGEARIGDLVAEVDFQRPVRVLMAAVAVRELVMGSAGVAHAACRDIVLRGRAMAGVAVGAGHILMFCTGGGDVGGWAGMAFCAVLARERGRSFGSSGLCC